MEKNMDKDRKSKKYLIGIFVLSLCLMGCGVIFLIVGEYVNGDRTIWWSLAGFFVCVILGIKLLISKIEDFIFYDIDEKSKKYDAVEFSKLKNISKNKVKESFLSHKFKETERGYLRRKIFSFTKDAICYYVKSVNSFDLENTIEKEFELMDMMDEKSKSVCLILVIYKNELKEKDFDEVRQISKDLIISETVFQLKSCHTSVLVLVDSTTNEGYFLDINSKIDISIYGHGCRLIKKYLKDEV